MTTSNCPLGFLTGKNSLPFWPPSDLWCWRYFTLRATWCTSPVHKYNGFGLEAQINLFKGAFHPDKEMSCVLRWTNFYNTKQYFEQHIKLFTRFLFSCTTICYSEKVLNPAKICIILDVKIDQENRSNFCILPASCLFFTELKPTHNGVFASSASIKPQPTHNYLPTHTTANLAHHSEFRDAHIHCTQRGQASDAGGQS